MSSTPRDKSATWHTLGALCRERDWSRRRLIQELQGGLRYRTIPPGRTIDWHDPNVEDSLNVETSEVWFYDEKVAAKERSYSSGLVTFLSLGKVTVGIEVLPPTEALPAPAPSFPLTAASSSSPTSSTNVSEADVRDCLLAIVKERPNNPLDEDELPQEMERRLGMPVGRNRARKLRTDYAPQWVNPVGRPPKSAQ